MIDQEEFYCKDKI